MYIGIALILSILIILIFKKSFLKNENFWYIGAGIVSTLCLTVAFLGSRSAMIALIVGGSLSGALFIIVMYTGAFKSGKVRKFLLPIRRQLSIFACIFAFAQNIYFGKTYFIMLFSGEHMNNTDLLGTILSLVMIGLLLPLFLTSFLAVRKKMKNKTWKKLQRLSYLFYGLLFIHVVVVNWVGLTYLDSKNIINVSVYSLIFLSYFILRLSLTENKKNYALSKPSIAISFVIVTALIGFGAYTSQPLKASPEMEEEVIVVAEEPTSKPEETETIEEETESGITDGVYSGTGSGYKSDIVVETTISNGVIASISIVENGDDRQYYENGLDSFLSRIIEANSTNVDGISGATFTSEGIKKAIDSGLNR